MYWIIAHSVGSASFVSSRGHCQVLHRKVKAGIKSLACFCHVVCILVGVALSDLLLFHPYAVIRQAVKLKGLFFFSCSCHRLDVFPESHTSSGSFCSPFLPVSPSISMKVLHGLHFTARAYIRVIRVVSFDHVHF